MRQSAEIIAFFLVAIMALNVLASPALKELPSITYDSLYSNGDQETAETGPISGVTGALAGYTAYNAIRNMLRTEPQAQQSRMNIILTPFRMVRNAGSSAMSMAKTFANTFTTEFKKQYNTLSTDVKERVLPEVGNFMGMKTFEVPQRESNEWLEGV